MVLYNSQSAFILNHLIFSITLRGTQDKGYYSHFNEEMMLGKIKIKL